MYLMSGPVIAGYACSISKVFKQPTWPYIPGYSFYASSGKVCLLLRWKYI